MKSESGINQTRSKTFYGNVIPAIGSMLVTSLYVVVDGIFVGQGISADALAAINLAGPYIMVIVAIAMMLTVGGATVTAIALGQGKQEEANRYFTTSMKLLLAFSLLMTVVSVLFPEPIARLMGASPALLKDTATYLRYFVLFSIFFCCAMALAAFVRNDGAPKLAFWGMVMGGVSNIFLDWLFIFPLHMGIMGPAIASGLGQTLSCVILLSHFIRGKGQLHLRRSRVQGKVLWEIVKRGTPEFMNQLFQPITVLCYNLIAIRVFGEIGVSAFSVVYYILTITVSVFTGLTQGVQPLIGRSFGAEDRAAESYYYRKSIRVNLILALIVYGTMALFGSPIIALFNPDPTLNEIGFQCIRIYGISFLLTAVNTVIISYLTATKRTGQALVLSALRCLLFIPICVFAMPALFGRWAVWTGITVAELLSILCAVILGRREKKGKS